MEAADRELVKKALPHNHELAVLYRDHERLDEEISRREKRTFKTNQEEAEIRSLKLEKLRGVERMLAIVSVVPS